jgi:phage tail tape-measure protein
MRSLTLAAATLAIGLACGCETMKENPRTTGTIGGAAAGAAVGAAVDKDHPARGATIGGVAGGAAGNYGGQVYKDQQNDKKD